MTTDRHWNLRYSARSLRGFGRLGPEPAGRPSETPHPARFLRPRPQAQSPPRSVCQAPRQGSQTTETRPQIMPTDGRNTGGVAPSRVATRRSVTSQRFESAIRPLRAGGSPSTPPPTVVRPVYPLRSRRRKDRVSSKLAPLTAGPLRKPPRRGKMAAAIPQEFARMTTPSEAVEIYCLKCQTKTASKRVSKK